ncbi:MAG TPA: T9SS type A sorting domain-containing protein [Puia sp.]|jgi:hypothetical protein
MTFTFTCYRLRGILLCKKWAFPLALYGSFFLFFISTTGRAQNPTLESTTQIGGAGAEQVHDVTMDAAGNMYYAGSFGGTIDADPGPGTTTLTATAASTDGLLLKVDASGNLVWARQFGGTSTDQALQIKLDGTGNIYVSGLFTGTADLDPGTGTHNVTSVLSSDRFIEKLDASGNLVWVKTIPISGTPSFDIDGSGEVYMVGSYSGSIDLGTGTMTSAGGNDAFVFKLDNSGNVVYAGSVGGVNNESAGSPLVDGSGNLYFSGTFSGTSDFDPGAGTFNLTAAATNGYIVKLDASGALAWAGSMASTSATSVSQLGLDGSGNIYVTGTYTGTADLDPTSGVNNQTAGGTALFHMNIDGSGNPSNIVSTGSSGAVTTVTAMLVDAAGNSYITGKFTGTVDFDPGSGDASLTASGTTFFLLKLDATGNFAYAMPVSSSNILSSPVNSLQLDAAGVLYASGYFQGTLTVASTTLTSAGSSDIDILKLDPPIPLPLNLLSFDAQKEKQQVQLNWVTADEENVSHFEILRSSDGSRFDTIGQVSATNSALSSSYAFTDAHPLPGTGWYRLRMVDIDGAATYSPVRVIDQTTGAVAFRVYPVPARDVLNIDAPVLTGATGQIAIQFYNAAGQLVRTALMQQGTVYPLTVSQLTPGMYMLRLVASDGRQEVKSVLIR